MGPIMRTVLSIDFDFWVKLEAAELLDWGHREALFFINQVWGIRAASALANGEDLRQIYTLPTDEVAPECLMRELKRKKLGFKKTKGAIAESHMCINGWLDGLRDLHVINIDAHHDLGYSGRSELDCSNWLLHLIEAGHVRKVTQIYPKWRLNSDEWSDEMSDRVAGLDVDYARYYGLENLPTGLPIDKVFVCRSGAWSPPWLDEHFISVVGAVFGYCSRVVLIGKDVSNPIEPRMFDWKAVELAAEQYKRVIASVGA